MHRVLVVRSLAAGLVGGCAFVLIELLGRTLLQAPTLPEIVQDPLLLSLPGPVFAFLLERLLYLAKPLFFVLLLLLQIVAGGLAGLIDARLRQPFGLAFVLWLVTGALLAQLTSRGLFGGDADVALVALVGFAVYGFVLWLSHRPVWSTTNKPVSVTRRKLLAGAVMLLVSVGLAGRVIADMAARRSSAAAADGSAALPASWTGVAVPPGLPPPITAPDDFYVVSKNLQDPVVDIAEWQLQVTGLVNQPLNLSYDALDTLPSVQVIQTLECISNEVGGNLMSTGLWTGLRLGDLLQQAGIKDAATAIVFHSVDGYTETMALTKALDPSSLLAYELDGQPLPTKHGFPLRVLGTGTYGMKNPKWLSQIDVVATAQPGFWEQQGWNPDAPVQTMTRIDRPTDDDTVTGATDIGGVAFAGDRGIQRIEVSADGGSSWSEAELLPPLGSSTWVLWHLPWQPVATGRPTLAARAVDGTGQPQSDRRADPFPDGSSGYHSVRVVVG